MKVLLRSDHIAGIPQRWFEQYKDWKDAGNKWDKGPITKALKELPEGFTAEQVDTLIGNSSWTRFECDECKQPAEKLIHVDDGSDDYEGHKFDLCPKCLRQALKMLKETN